jgi:hypothetical protein
MRSLSPTLLSPVQLLPVQLSRVLLGLGLFLCVATPSALADDGQLFAGEITRVDVAAEQIFLKGNVTLNVIVHSELFDRAGEKIDLAQLQAALPPPHDGKSGRVLDEIPYAFYKFQPRNGKLYVQELHLGKIPR